MRTFSAFLLLSLCANAFAKDFSLGLDQDLRLLCRASKDALDTMDPDAASLDVRKEAMATVSLKLKSVRGRHLAAITRDGARVASGLETLKAFSDAQRPVCAEVRALLAREDLDEICFVATMAQIPRSAGRVRLWESVLAKLVVPEVRAKLHSMETFNPQEKYAGLQRLAADIARRPHWQCDSIQKLWADDPPAYQGAD